MPQPVGSMIEHLPDSEEYTSYPLTELLTPPGRPPRPDDFADFWRDTFDELCAPATEPRLVRDEGDPGREVLKIDFRSSSGERVLAWLIGPQSGHVVRRGMVISHGYGGRAEPDPSAVPADAAAIFPVAPWLPANPGGVPGAEHVLIGIGDRFHYSHRYSVADIWRSATVLIDRYPETAACLDFHGGSFGGGIGALALPWDDRFRRGVLNVPSFGHYPIRLSRPCTGSGEAVRQHLIEYPDDRTMFSYFDAAVAAESIMNEVLVGAALLDPAVDPRGQFAIYHALGGTKQLVVRTAGHAEFDGQQAEDEEFNRLAREFLNAPSVAAARHLLC